MVFEGASGLAYFDYAQPAGFFQALSQRTIVQQNSALIQRSRNELLDAFSQRVVVQQNPALIERSRNERHLILCAKPATISVT